MRDMLLSMLALAALVLGALLLTGAVSFDPGGPDVDRAAAPARDAHAELASAAARVPFSLRDPTVPASWHCNSAATVPIGSGSTASVAVEVGWITPSDGYLRLAQSGGSVPDLVARESGRDDGAVHATGTVTVGGQTWQVYPGRRAEQAWVGNLGGTHVLITGSASGQQFRTLAAALPGAAVLPHTSGTTG